MVAVSSKIFSLVIHSKVRYAPEGRPLFESMTAKMIVWDVVQLRNVWRLKYTDGRGAMTREDLQSAESDSII